MSHWDSLIRDPARTAQQVSRLVTGFLVAGLVLVPVWPRCGLPSGAAGCQVHSGSNDVCPDG